MNMKKFKKIYIEITNICNLNCSFCPQDNVDKKEMSPEEFEQIIKKIDKYTDYIYLHVKGEPLLHSKLNEIIEIAFKYNKKINITTNGVLLKQKKEYLTNIREINISLQSLINTNYLEDIFETAETLSKNTFIEYRLWIENQYSKEILNKIYKRYNTLENKLAKNIYFTKDKPFIWPNLSNEVIRKSGTCYGTRHHIAILVNGTVVPCCLDSKGIINLGNIFNTSLEGILESTRYKNIKNNFENNKLSEELCTKCGFIN